MIRARSLGMALAAFGGALSGAPAVALENGAAQSCDRSCLKGVVADYLEAMARDDSSLLDLSTDVRATSNSREVSPGEGETWVKGITINNRHTFVDARARTAIFFGTIAGPPVEAEGEKRVWWHYALRLTTDTDGRLVEIEEQSTLTGMQTVDKVPTPFTESAIFNSMLPENSRSDAAALVEIADGYWDALTTGEASDAEFGPDCQRTEFGVFSTNNPMEPHGRGQPNWVPAPQTGPSCISFFDRPRFRWPVTNRRYYLVDEARGVVVGIGQLNRFGENGNDPLTLFEAFKIIDGKIEWLWAPAFSWNTVESGWPDWSRDEHVLETQE